VFFNITIRYISAYRQFEEISIFETSVSVNRAGLHQHILPHTCFDTKNTMANKPLTYEGCNFLRQRLVLASLSGKAVKIKQIRSKEDNPGLKGRLGSK